MSAQFAVLFSRLPFGPLLSFPPLLCFRVRACSQLKSRKPNLSTRKPRRRKKKISLEQRQNAEIFAPRSFCARETDIVRRL
jgi:hypothetical protein